ncbi:hypothetical protein H5410_017848 [Solanum commersonii]|uniref:Uncharacterized protein n=1 Tax=Solanum commersonii TaxID=4109 RepID=A0A9J6A0M6_SOLCO|nr:hypothetical protein H5410_017848 [Solanum commersonii]
MKQGIIYFLSAIMLGVYGSNYSTGWMQLYYVKSTAFNGLCNTQGKTKIEKALRAKLVDRKKYQNL